MNIKKIKHGILETGILLKLINGIFEFFLGIFILFLNSERIDLFIRRILANEITEKNDLIANTLLNFANNLSIGTKEFIGIYIIIHGIINIFLFSVIWKDKIKLFPLSIAILMMMTAYQIYRFYHTHSTILFFITFIDMIIIYLIADHLIKISQKKLRRVQ